MINLQTVEAFTASYCNQYYQIATVKNLIFYQYLIDTLVVSFEIKKITYQQLRNDFSDYLKKENLLNIDFRMNLKSIKEFLGKFCQENNFEYALNDHEMWYKSRN